MEEKKERKQQLSKGQQIDLIGIIQEHSKYNRCEKADKEIAQIAEKQLNRDINDKTVSYYRRKAKIKGRKAERTPQQKQRAVWKGGSTNRDNAAILKVLYAMNANIAKIADRLTKRSTKITTEVPK